MFQCIKHTNSSSTPLHTTSWLCWLPLSTSHSVALLHACCLHVSERVFRCLFLITARFPDTVCTLSSKDSEEVCLSPLSHPSQRHCVTPGNKQSGHRLSAFRRDNTLGSKSPWITKVGEILCLRGEVKRSELIGVSDSVRLRKRKWVGWWEKTRQCCVNRRKEVDCKYKNGWLSGLLSKRSGGDWRRHLSDEVIWRLLEKISEDSYSRLWREGTPCSSLNA